MTKLASNGDSSSWRHRWFRRLQCTDPHHGKADFSGILNWQTSKSESKYSSSTHRQSDLDILTLIGALTGNHKTLDVWQSRIIEYEWRSAC